MAGCWCWRGIPVSLDWWVCLQRRRGIVISRFRTGNRPSAVPVENCHRTGIGKGARDPRGPKKQDTPPRQGGGVSVALARWPDNSRLVGEDSVDTKRCRIPETSRHEALKLLPVLVVVEEVYFWSNHQVGCVMVVAVSYTHLTLPTKA